ncbi:tyrosine-type recombinase/integrase [Mycolicibacterium sphagni]|uniref:Site-specific integrase n=1 Tax=Mycolicibacterium sphagni TaxID=1786 RepID=A0A255DTU3_9MYCO|nr:tyrosine-type recombinase/integrase [Mycolicibacterium sphagni]OYN80402.1 site-specific integrase [Mycolicibacterium sphagni]
MGFQPKKKRAPRAKGEGSIFQRKDGMWVGSVEAAPGPNGERRQKRVYAKDHRALVAKLDELKLDNADGLNLNRTITVAKWLDYWLPNIQKSRVRPTTYRDYGHTVTNIANTIGHKRLADLTAADVRRMHALIGKGERRTQKAHIVLGQALKDAIADGLIKRNVTDAVDTPEYVAGEREPLSAIDVHKLLAYADANRNRMESTRWKLLFLTGTRQGESLGLTWDRVDLEAGAMDISWQLQQLRRAHGCGDRHGDGTWPCGRKNGGHCTNPQWDTPVKFEYQPLHASMALTRPKSKAGQRWVPVIKPLQIALTELKEADIGPNPHNLVFHRANGAPVIPNEDSRAWHALLRDAGIIGKDETLPLHTTRHTAATVLRAAGADEQTRMEILGHNSPEVTRIYAHADQAKNSVMMDALAVLMPTKKS